MSTKQQSRSIVFSGTSAIKRTKEQISHFWNRPCPSPLRRWACMIKIFYWILDESWNTESLCLDEAENRTFPGRRYSNDKMALLGSHFPSEPKSSILNYIYPRLYKYPRLYDSDYLVLERGEVNNSFFQVPVQFSSPRALSLKCSSVEKDSLIYHWMTGVMNTEDCHLIMLANSGSVHRKVR